MRLAIALVIAAVCAGRTTRNYNVYINDPQADVSFEFLVERTTSVPVKASIK